MAKFIEVTLDTACEGAAKELFERGLKEVMANIQDVNTDPEGKRKLALVFTFKPAEDRASAVISLDCDTKLAPVCSIGGSIFIVKEPGGRKAYASSAKQEPLFPQTQDTKPEAAATA